MSEVLRVVLNVATPLALLGVIAALGYFAYTRRLRHEEARLGALPPEERARAEDRFLTRYRIDAGGATPVERMALIREEMEKRHRLSVLLVIVTASVFVICFALAVLAYLFGGRTAGSTPTTADLSTHSVRPKLEIASFDFPNEQPKPADGKRLTQFDLKLRNNTGETVFLTGVRFVVRKYWKLEPLPFAIFWVSGPKGPDAEYPINVTEAELNTTSDQTDRLEAWSYLLKVSHEIKHGDTERILLNFKLLRNSVLKDLANQAEVKDKIDFQFFILHAHVVLIYNGGNEIASRGLIFDDTVMYVDKFKEDESKGGQAALKGLDLLISESDEDRKRRVAANLKKIEEIEQIDSTLSESARRLIELVKHASREPEK